ncbi:MAG: lipoate--protein ligase family protein [Inquilinus sp.]|nr:lipoate--protein ligase family protein [Inquilinus sp.]
MTRPFRVIDTGLREGRANIAFDQALIDAHKAGDIPDTIRFLRFPPTALIGRHQALSHELKLDHCRQNGIGIVRRITGGGAIYFDEGQLGWELVFSRATLGISNLADLAREICEAAAAGLGTLGVAAKYRPRNDIEVDGRKLCGTGGFFDGDTLFYQGTVLIDLNPADMVAALRVAEAKLAKRALDSASQRVTTLKQLLGDGLPDLATIQAALLKGFADRLGIAPEWGAITAGEETLATQAFDEEIGTDSFVHEIDDPESGGDVLSASHTGPGGTVSAYLRLEGPRQDRVREVLFTGDFFVTPPRIVFDLEASLRGLPTADLGAGVERFFADAPVDLLTIAPADFRSVAEAALGSR